MNTDNVTQTFPASVVAGLGDDRVLALFTSGFFCGFVFGFERFILRIGGYNIRPARYTGASEKFIICVLWDTLN